MLSLVNSDEFLDVTASTVVDTVHEILIDFQM